MQNLISSKLQSLMQDYLLFLTYHYDQEHSYKQLPFPYILLCFPLTHLAGVKRSPGSASITEILQKNKKMTTMMNPMKHIPYNKAPVVLIEI